MKTIMVAMLLTMSAGGALGGDRPLLGDRESPRATDLLRAQKLADQAQRRLEIPRQRSAKWKRGGGGWNTPGREPSEGPDSVIINLRPPRRRGR
jgi:hypothetical protein